MREYELIIDKAFTSGLNPLDTQAYNIPYFDECYGFKVGQGGLECYVNKLNPFLSVFDLTYSWPFPQVLQGERYTFLIDKVDNTDYIYLVDDATSTNTLIFTTTHNGLYELADFGKYVIFSNGLTYFHLNTITNTWVTYFDLDVVPMMRAFINFNGQVVGGNVTTDWYDCDECFYVWSKIGNLNLVPDSMNESGYRRCPYGGEVLNVKQLAGDVIGYSSKGITKLIPMMEPIPTFGFVPICDVGVINKGAINGSLTKHVFLGSDYVLRVVDQEGVKELGYKQYMSRLTNNDVIVSYDKINKEFYITDGKTCFLLTSKGLTEIPQCPSAVWEYDKTVAMLPEYVKMDRGVITTAIHDFNYSGQKTVFIIESNVSRVEDIYCSIDYIHDLNTWYETGEKPLNNQGIATNITSGNMFRFNLHFNNLRQDTKISQMKVRYKMTDLRGIRGVYAPPMRGQGLSYDQ